MSDFTSFSIDWEPDEIDETRRRRVGRHGEDLGVRRPRPQGDTPRKEAGHEGC